MEINQYLEELFVNDTSLLERVIKRLENNQMPQISIDLAAGEMLEWFIRMQQPKRALEIGALGGYSGSLICRSMGPDGRLSSLELKQEYADVAKETLEVEGYRDQVQYYVGPALDTMATLASSQETFDLIFIDADKQQYEQYLDAAVRIAEPGALIFADNVLRRNKVLNSEDTSQQNLNMRAFNQKVATHSGLDSFLFPVGDGVAVARVR
ncbi:O-methyltransferase [Aureibacillus halotolerans]|uniref:Putative O-methyltransferase YrrM n=1 Tax=Aureibacillus halotolerans TaxID=1508390 RepID=A0A4R6TZ91_9BACI|nr:O-methyltransferase [Aureibacillus halotolerans]TDQ36114.1 putative O-methyltransferase YrrM [Aureibacillus halotolerans]